MYSSYNETSDSLQKLIEKLTTRWYFKPDPSLSREAFAAFLGDRGSEVEKLRDKRNIWFQSCKAVLSARDLGNTTEQLDEHFRNFAAADFALRDIEVDYEGACIEFDQKFNQMPKTIHALKEERTQR